MLPLPLVSDRLTPVTVTLPVCWMVPPPSAVSLTELFEPTPVTSDCIAMAPPLPEAAVRAIELPLTAPTVVMVPAAVNCRTEPVVVLLPAFEVPREIAPLLLTYTLPSVETVSVVGPAVVLMIIAFPAIDDPMFPDPEMRLIVSPARTPAGVSLLSLPDPSACNVIEEPLPTAEIAELSNTPTLDPDAPEMSIVFADIVPSVVMAPVDWKSKVDKFVVAFPNAEAPMWTAIESPINALPKVLTVTVPAAIAKRAVSEDPMFPLPAVNVRVVAFTTPAV